MVNPEGLHDKLYKQEKEFQRTQKMSEDELLLEYGEVLGNPAKEDIKSKVYEYFERSIAAARDAIKEEEVEGAKGKGE